MLQLNICRRLLAISWQGVGLYSREVVTVVATVLGSTSCPFAVRKGPTDTLVKTPHVGVVHVDRSNIETEVIVRAKAEEIALVVGPPWDRPRPRI